MKKISEILLTVAAVLSFAVICAAQTGEIFSDKSGGYSFAAPAGFTVSKSGQGFSLVDAANTYLILVSTHRYNDAKAFADNANLEKDGLTLTGDGQLLGDTGFYFRSYKDTAQGRVFVDSFVLFSPYGGGIIVVAMAEARNAGAAFENAARLYRSARFSKPAESEAGSGWQAFLSGKHLLYLYTGNGYSERRDIYLCSNGNFYFRNDASSISMNGTGAIAGNASGTWKVSSGGADASLILNFNDGDVSEYALSKRKASNEIGLNGKRYFVQNDGNCR